jgi:hypothetical protein
MSTATTLASLALAARDGDEVALMAWADGLEEQGDLEAAAAVRAVPGLAAEMREFSQAWQDLGAKAANMAIRLELPRWGARHGWWTCDGYWGSLGDEERGWALHWRHRTRHGPPIPERLRDLPEPGYEEPAIGVLLARWDQLCPALEYLGRRIGKPMVRAQVISTRDVRGHYEWGGTLRWTLRRRGEHLTALKAKASQLRWLGEHPPDCQAFLCIFREARR